MAWLRVGDNAATNPRVMRLDADPEAEDWTLNEVFGFVVRCAIQSAGHMTDYVLDYGTAKLVGNGRHELLLAQAERAGLLTRKGGRGRSREWLLVDDPEFLHLRLRDEVEFERQRKRDASNPDLTVPVRLRDGDTCRYCSVVVSWTDRKSARGATYDHREPGKAATFETYVVACLSCNASRRNDPKADERLPLLPPPPVPYYSTRTLEWLEKNGVDVSSRPGTDPARSATRPGSRDSRPGTDPARSATRTGPRDLTDTGQVETDHEGTDRDGTGTGRVGSGRAGQGRAGSAQVSASSDPSATSPAPRRRARRGRAVS